MDHLRINGQTGFEPAEERSAFAQRLLTEARAMPQDTPEQKEAATQHFSRNLGEHYASHAVAELHNTLAPLAAEFRTKTRTAAAAVLAVDDAYAELSKRTTTAWHAAHHRLTLTAVEARDALSAAITVAEKAHAANHKLSLDPNTNSYDRLVPAEQHVVMPDLDSARLALVAFMETATEMFAVCRATLVGQYPEGFAPAPTAAERSVDAHDTPDYAW